MVTPHMTAAVESALVCCVFRVCVQGVHVCMCVYVMEDWM